MATDLKSELKNDLTAAMKARDAVTTSTLRMTLTAVSNAEKAGKESVILDDAAVLKIINGEAKRRAESAEVYETNGRQELADAENAERAVLEKYLPAAMSEHDLNDIVTTEVAAGMARGLSGPKAMGPIIAAVKARTDASADPSRIAAAVKAALANAD